jgi:hypothetical protein
MGYGVCVNGSVTWDGRSECFAQFVNDGSAANLTDADFGRFEDLADFRASGQSRSPDHLFARLLIRMLTRSANRRVEALRQAA